LPFFFEEVASGGEEIAFVELPLFFEGVNMSCTVEPIWVCSSTKIRKKRAKVS
jgi:hypothetical protein